MLKYNMVIEYKYKNLFLKWNISFEVYLIIVMNHFLLDSSITAYSSKM